jgi:hypothetical protein
LFDRVVVTEHEVPLEAGCPCAAAVVVVLLGWCFEPVHGPFQLQGVLFL